jgi:8-oxo-dGTP pyrophosphatase MutT (NUDIX family)
MLLFSPPSDFSPIFEVVSCFLERPDGTFVLLHRPPGKSQENKWGNPGGKIDAGETLPVAMRREILEETGIDLAEDQLQPIRSLFVRYPDKDFVYHMFRAGVPQETEVTLNPKEHDDFIWTTPKDSLTLPLVEDFDPCIRLKYGL